jgi:glycine cleavage system regulatory protein
MWTDEKQKQFDALRGKECAGTLTAEEQAQLETFFTELDAEEAERLRPAMERMGAEIEAGRKELVRLQTIKAARETLLAKRAALLARAQQTLAELQAEESRLQAEFEMTMKQQVAA